MHRILCIVFAIMMSLGVIIFLAAVVDIAAAREAAEYTTDWFSMSTSNGALLFCMMMLIMSIFGLVIIYSTFPEKEVE